MVEFATCRACKLVVPLVIDKPAEPDINPAAVIVCTLVEPEETVSPFVQVNNAPISVVLDKKFTALVVGKPVPCLKPFVVDVVVMESTADIVEPAAIVVDVANDPERTEPETPIPPKNLAQPVVVEVEAVVLFTTKAPAALIVKGVLVPKVVAPETSKVLPI